MTTRTKILIFDDHADLLDALTIFLEEESFEVCTVVSTELFRTELLRFEPDIIILDVYINGNINGREICKIIKADPHTRHIPIILMSASVSALKNFEECSADEILSKPFDLSDLLQKIHHQAKFNIEKVIAENRTESVRLVSLMSKK